MIPTDAEIELLPLSKLVLLYGSLAPSAGQNPVKKFETRPIAIKRTLAVAAALRAKPLLPPTEWPLQAMPEEKKAEHAAQVAGVGAARSWNNKAPVGPGVPFKKIPVEDEGEVMPLTGANMLAVLTGQPLPDKPKAKYEPEVVKSLSGAPTLSIADKCREVVRAGLDDEKGLAEVRAYFAGHKFIPANAVRYYREHMGKK